jgi:hypothetical protein
MRLPISPKYTVDSALHISVASMIYPANHIEPRNVRNVSCGSCRADCQDRHKDNETAVIECYRTLCQRLCSYDVQSDH